MPGIVSDIVDVYVFRRLNARVQFLLLQRRHDVAMPMTWQGFHAQIESGETTLDAARRAVREMVGLNISAFYSADYVNQFYDDYRDVLVLAPVVAVNVSPQAPVRLGEDFRDCAWFERDDATVRLPFSGQRWAVRHIDELMSIGERESELYRLLPPDQLPPAETIPSVSEHDVSTSHRDTTIGSQFDEIPKPSDPASVDFSGPSLGDIMEPEIRELSDESRPTEDAEVAIPVNDTSAIEQPSPGHESRWRLRRRERTGGDGVY